MSVSEHPIALGVERRVAGEDGRATRLLATVMALPLVDGVFPALVLAGALTYPFGLLETGLLIFGGSATVAVILAEMDASPREAATSVLLIGAVLIPVAVLEAAVAPALASVLDLAIFERFAGLVILTIAARTASAKVCDYLPRPAVIVGLGAVAAVDPAGASFALTLDPGLMARAGGAAAVGVAFALAIALLGPRLRAVVDLDRFRFGSAVALGVLALSVLGLLPTTAPVALVVLGVSALFAYDPDGAPAAGASAGDEAASIGAESAPIENGDGAGGGRPDGRAADGGAERAIAAEEGGEDEDPDHGYGYPGEGESESRAPWM